MKNLTETKARGFKVENGKLVYFTNILEGYRHEFKDLQEICKEMNGMMEKHDSYMAQIEFWKCDAETYKIWKDKLIEELKHNITEKQEQKLFNGLFNEIVSYVKKRSNKMKKSIFDCKHIECCMDGCYCKINKGSVDWNICSNPCKYWEKKTSEAYMTSPIGDLPINSDGLRKAIDEIVRLKQELNKLKKKCEYNKDDICVNADSKYLADYCPKDDINNIVRDIYRKGKELDENFDITVLGEYIMANFLSEENENERN